MFQDKKYRDPAKRLTIEHGRELQRSQSRGIRRRNYLGQKLNARNFPLLYSAAPVSRDQPFSVQIFNTNAGIQLIEESYTGMEGVPKNRLSLHFCSGWILDTCLVV